MDKKYFTLEQANAMIPSLNHAFYRMMQMHNQIQKLFITLDKKGFMPQGETFELNPRGAKQDIIADLASLRMLLDELKQQLTELLEKGAIVKDLEKGLVDWYANIEDADIFLCWQYGEKEVSHWHNIEEGFSGRRSIDELKSAE